MFANWTSLTTVDYALTCERCQQLYPFPQAELRRSNKNWAYRVVGPFATPDYARGAYATVLTLSLLKSFGFSHNKLTYVPGLLCETDQGSCEIDFAALFSYERLFEYDQPQWIFGETKSAGLGDLLRRGDVERVWSIASRFPGSFLVFSVLRDDFTLNEKKVLKRLVRKCDRNGHGLILLTGNELFFDFSVTETWKRLGGEHARLAELQDVQSKRELQGLARATQELYLD